MTKIIHLETEHAWQVDSRLKNSAADLHALYSRLQRDRARLDHAWQSPTATRYMGQLDRLLARLEAQIERLYRLEGRLGREIEEWITVDQGHPFGKPGAGYAGSGAVWGAGGGYYSGGGGGGAGGGAWGPGGDGLEGPTEYELLRGIQVQYYEKYMEGEMTWEEAMQAMEEEWKKDPFKRDWVNVEGEIWKREGAVDGYVWRDRFLDDHVEVGVLGYELKGTAKAGLNKDGLQGQLGGEAGLYLGKAEANYEIAGVTAAGVAYLGANAAGDVHVNVQNPITGKVGAGAEVDAFIGGKAGGTISRDFEDLGIPVEVGATGAVSYGLGVHAEANVGMDQGVVSVEFEYGAAFGLGAEGGINVKVDVISAAEKVVDAGEAVIDWLW